MRKINEIFHSIQGEGCHTGVPSVFIRFSGCNLKCNFCDTSHEDGEWLTDDEIIERAKSRPSQQVVLTGGEPSLFIDEGFIKKLKYSLHLPIAIETNGTRELPDEIDWVTVSPKTGVQNFGDATVRVKHADELKVVDTGQPLDGYFGLDCVGPSTVMLLQPCYVADSKEREQNTRQTIRRVLEDPRWRLSLQTHRFIGIQ